TTAGDPAPDFAFGRASKNFRAAFAVEIIFLAARLRTPSGLPSPQTSAGRMDWWRSSIRSQTAWPTRWFETAWHERPLALSRSHFSRTYPFDDRALSTSKWSPQQASSTPSYPIVLARGASF